MRSTDERLFPMRGDGLRLLALGRVPRCVRCPRYRALADARALGLPPRSRLPEVPASCSYQFCAPLSARYRSALERREPATRAAARG